MEKEQDRRWQAAAMEAAGHPGTHSDRAAGPGRGIASPRKGEHEGQLPTLNATVGRRCWERQPEEVLSWGQQVWDMLLWQVDPRMESCPPTTDLLPFQLPPQPYTPL